VSISCIQVLNGNNKVLLKVTPNAFPCQKVIARKEPGDDGLVEFVQVRVNTDAMRCEWRVVTSLTCPMPLGSGSELVDSITSEAAR
jgi:hypothetical protein